MHRFNRLIIFISQDLSCWEIAPQLPNCIECRLIQLQRSRGEPINVNSVCRFYAFRRLRYTKSGQIAFARFLDPVE